MRGGGSVGISEIKWNVSANNGQDPSLDIQPSGGSLFFSSGIIIKTISLSVLADSVPELQEVRRRAAMIAPLMDRQNTIISFLNRNSQSVS